MLSSGSGSPAERLRRSRRRLLVVTAVLLVGIGIGVAIADPFAAKHASSGSIDNGAPTALQTVRRRSLTAQETVEGTLGYAEVWTVAVPSASPAYGSVAIYTMLPAPGDEIRRGQVLYSVNELDTLILYGSMPSWRSLTIGVPPGRDVAQLNANLRALGFGSGVGDSFTRSTEQAIKALQRAHGLPVTGSLPLGSVVFEPRAARVMAVTPTAGQSVVPGPIMTLSSTSHSVSIQLDVSDQSQVKEGDHVLVTLPDNSSTPGVVASVGKVATMPSGGQVGNGNAAPSSPSIPVSVRLLRPHDAGTLDQAPVNVLVTTARVRNALVVPVNALVALAGGGYALEEVIGKQTHRLIPVTPGLFDDQEGLVQVKGAGVAAGQRVVVPAS